MFDLKRVLGLLCLLGFSHAFLKLPTLEETVLSQCYEININNGNSYYPKKIPYANSLDNFLYIVEKLEETYKPYELIDILLNRFTILNLQLGSFPRQDRKRSSDNREVLLSDFLIKSSKVQFDEGLLKDDEKCSLFFMMTHYFQNKSSQSTEVDEMGVIGIDSAIEPAHAVALYKVILGIHAGLNNKDPLTLLKIMQKYTFEQGAFNDVPQNEKIDRIFSITLGDYLSYAVTSLIDNDFRKRDVDVAYGENSYFRTPLCHREYTLPNEPELFTLSEMRGALDGFFIGQQSEKLVTDGMTVSDILRMYYKPDTNREKQFSYCDRRILYDSLAGSYELNLKLHVYMLEVIEKPHYSAENIDRGVRQALEDFLTKIEDLAYGVYSDKESRCVILPRTTDYACDKQNDLFFVLNRASNLPLQLEVVNNVVNAINLGEGKGSASIILNTRGMQNNALLNISNAGEVACKLHEVFNQSTFSAVNDEATVLRQLNETLRDFKTKTKEYPHVPGRAVIYFAYGGKTTNTAQKIEEMTRELNGYHSDIPFFLVGDNAKSLENLLSKSTTIKATSAGDIASEIKKRLCRNSVTLQYPECDAPQQSESNFNYDGRVAPDHQQFITMFPEYFHRTFTMKFTVETEATKLKVCHIRDKPDELTNEANCNTVSPGEPFERHISNPCRRETIQSCNPLYFVVSSREPSTGPAVCTEQACKRPDEVKFTISHENVRCSKAWNIPSSPLFILVAAFVASIKTFKFL